MSVGPDPAPSATPEGVSRRALRAAERRRTRSGRGVAIVGVLGERLITAGVVVLLYIGWQLWFTEITVGHEQRVEASEQHRAWNEHAAATPTPAPTPTRSDAPSAHAQP